ncbi:ABC transporter ATP-binding protein [Synechococcus sp. PCC 7336]|uniref:ABC transporter ATP-binding protein n=1 Tax=Synechococcus sp. PCC 7336 TaxID=195250 RepID=UPI00037464A1|nr:ABC transporter ATP-binding protein [Synechococcus sp. PCC 7336]
MAPVLIIDGIWKHYFRGRDVLQDLSLQLEEGELLGLLGISGSGKTTLLRLIAGFERPNRGQILIRDRVVASPHDWVPPEQRQVGVVFQDYALFPHLTLKENVAFGLKKSAAAKSLSKEVARQQVKEAIALVGLQDFQDRYPAELSGGQQQRVALARALAPQPQLILLDEPFSNLDAGIRYRLRLQVREILSRANIAGVFVTHDQEEALSISDRVAVLHKGRLEQCDRPETIYRAPRTRFVAEFVTQANFLTASRTDGGWQTEIGLLGENEASDRPEDRVEVMVRQEDCSLVPDEASEVYVRGRQFLGHEAIYCLQLPSGREMHVRQLDELQPIPTGARIRLELKPDFAPQCFPANSDI